MIIWMGIYTIIERGIQKHEISGRTRTKIAAAEWQSATSNQYIKGNIEISSTTIPLVFFDCELAKTVLNVCFLLYALLKLYALLEPYQKFLKIW